MEIIIQILIAMGSLISPEEYSEDFISLHEEEVTQAYTIYENNWYREVEGGVIIDEEANP